MAPKSPSYPILLLEDDLTLQHTLMKALTQHGYMCYTPLNVPDAFSYLNASHIRLIVADLKMSWANTLDLCQMIKRSKQLSHIPFVFISGSCDEREIKAAFLRGCDDFLAKPFHISELLTTIETLIRINEIQFRV